MHDIAVVGAGLAGSIAAAVLSRKGYDVVLIERHSSHPAEFRAEQIVGEQVAALRYLGVLEPIIDGVGEVRRAHAAHRGRIVDRADEGHYGLSYASCVMGARNAVPSHVSRIDGMVRGLALSDTYQAITMHDNRTVEARLVVLATGIMPLERFGFGRDVIRENHSLTLGFNLETTYPDILAYYGERVVDRIDYLTLFSMRVDDATETPRTRANLFCYNDIKDAWSQQFRTAPNDMLDRCLPGLKTVIGPYQVSGKVEARPVTLYRSVGVDRAGAVLIGDAFQTSCPAVGSGIGRLLTDIDVLCNLHLPRWFETEGMGTEKISAFYADPTKHAADAEALRSAEYRRDAATRTSIGWRLHRGRVLFQRKLRGWNRILPGASIPPLQVGKSAPIVRGVGH